MRSRMRASVPVLALALAVAGCTPRQAEEPTPTPPPTPFHVTGVQLGKAVRADMTVETPRTEFGRRDTVYASIASDGVTTGVTLKARWVYQDGNVVDEGSQTIATTGPSVTEFHVSMSRPWPRGKYMVEVWADTAAVDTVEYEVK